MKSFTINFFVRKAKKKNEVKQRIFARITVDGDRKDISIGRKVNPERWDSLRGGPKGNSDIELRRFLSTVEEKFFKIERELLENEIPITSDNLVSSYHGKTQKESRQITTLMQAFEFHNAQMQELKDSGQVARETNGRYKTTAKYVELMLKTRYKAHDIQLEDLNLEFCQNFEKWLRQNTDCATNSVMKYIKNLKKVTRMCMLHGWLNKDPFIFFKCKQDIVAREYLTQEEVDRVKGLKNLMERIHIIRQLFLLGCYTGLSYADLCSLKKEDMVLDKGQLWIIKKRKKTRVVSRIPILSIAKELLDELGEHPKAIRKNLLVPVFSNSNINVYLKELASLAQITKNLTFHVARHTFATTITLANGVSLEVVSAQLGHTNIRQTQHYARMVNSRIGSEMEKVNQILAKRYQSYSEGLLR